MAEKVRDYKRLGNQILEIVGKENVTNCVHCATRLRLVLKEDQDEFVDKVSKLPGVITVVKNSGQFQIVIGTHVGEVYDSCMSQLDLEDSAPVKASLLNRVIATMSAVFAPFIYVLAAAGILQGILILINMAWPAFASTGTYEVLSFISWTPFTFLPVLIGITASHHFKTNEFVAVFCCLALCNPTWAEIASRIAGGESVQFLMFNLSQTTYTSTVLPPLFLVLVLSYLERFLNKHINETVRALFVPLISVVIMVPLTLLILGPASDMLAHGIAVGYNWLVNMAPMVAGAIIGGFWQCVVIFGVHWGITPVILDNFATAGFDSFQAFQTCAVCAQVGACFGVWLKTRSKKMKGVSLSAGLTGLFGITEPSIYGVTLPLKKPFILACVSGAIGGVVVALFGAYQYVYAGLPGFLTVINAYDPSGVNSFSLYGEIIAVALSTILACGLTYFFGVKDTVDADEETNLEEAEKNEFIPDNSGNLLTGGMRSIVAAPVKGKLMPLEDVNDPVFSSGAMGKGAAILPENGNIVSPVDGEVVTVFPTGHAVGLKADSGAEVLIHVGMDTVSMNGEGFKIVSKNGQKVKKGDPLLEVDLDLVKSKGLSTVTPVIITNTGDFSDVLPYPAADVAAGDDILTVIS